MFNCEYCSKTFVQKCHVKRHKNYCKKRGTSDSEGDLPKCHHCDMTFSRRDSLNRHILTCPRIRPHGKRKRTRGESNSDESSPLNKKQRWCDLCNVDISQMHSHLRSASHKRSQKKKKYDDLTYILESAYKSRIISYRLLSKEKQLTPEDFMDSVCERVIKIIREKLHEVGGAIKINVELYGDYTKQHGDGDDDKEEKSFNSKNKVFYNNHDIEPGYNSFIEEIRTKADEFQEKSSGWALEKINFLEVNINKYSPLKGSNYTPLPKWIQDKHACVNVKNDDNACFAWAVVSALHPADKHSDRVSSYPHYKDVLKLEGVSFPMSFCGIRHFEVINDLSINVYEVNGRNIVGPLYLTQRKREKHINLLFIVKGELTHYCWVKSLSRLIREQLTKHQHQIFICDGCLLTFYDKAKYMEHTKHDCSHIKSIIPSEGDNILRFKNHYNQMRAPVVVYADFEALLKPVATCAPSGHSSYTCNYQLHEPYSFGYLIKCSYDDSKSKYFSYRGKNCAKEFLKSLKKELKFYAIAIKKLEPMLDLTSEQEDEFRSAITCHICCKALGEERVRDHNHLTGEFRGAAHSNCNLNYKICNKIPIVMHNLSGYDSHFIIKSLQKHDNIDIIPKNKENFISFTIKGLDLDIDLRFIDSFRFMASPLDKLVKNLSKSKLKNIISHFPSDKVDLLSRKGVFPYDYVDSWEKLEEGSLPAKEAFYSSLTNCDITDEDYRHAQKVWETFKVRTLGGYSDIYLKTDVMLLADVFENFRDVCQVTYNLDPAHYFTAPGLSWDAMLKHTGVELELLTDIAMIKFITSGIRGGLSQCSGKYSTANNKYMSDYDPDKESKYIVYLDANNLYGLAMSQYLPHKDFLWLGENEIKNFDLESLKKDSNKGYFLEVDLEYPSSLHDLHNDLPFCPENKIPSIGRTKTCKLLATLEEKSHYVIHYVNLQQALKHGLVLKKIHRILEFTQSPWLKPYIDLNTQKRASAVNTFEKDFFKLMNNSVFGKTMENVEKRVDVRIVTSWESVGKRLGARALISRLNFHSSAIIGNDITIIQMNKTKVKYDKPIYIGFSVLEISKCHMYHFHFSYMKEKYKDNVKLLYTDTDSFIYEIKTDNFYEDIKPDLMSRFDTSDFPVRNPYNLPLINKKVVGMMKDETNGEIIKEFIGIRSKCYYVKKEGNGVIKKIKGIKRNVVAKDVSGEDYHKCLTRMESQYRKMSVLRSKRHEIHTQTINKIALKNYDDKRFSIPEAPYETLALGHTKIDKKYFEFKKSLADIES